MWILKYDGMEVEFDSLKALCDYADRNKIGNSTIINTNVVNEDELIDKLLDEDLNKKVTN